MPCNCDGFPYVKNAFGKQYTGYAGAHAKLDQEIIKDGEKMLCRAQKVIRDLWELNDSGDEPSEELRVKVTAELDLLDSHIEREARLEDA